MTYQPKRRGRPRKALSEGEIATREMEARVKRVSEQLLSAPWGAGKTVTFAPIKPREATATMRLRVKDGLIQQAWQHENGIQWRTLPVVSADAPDWEEG